MITGVKIGPIEFEYFPDQQMLRVWKDDGDGHDINEFSRESWLKFVAAQGPSNGIHLTDDEARQAVRALISAGFGSRGAVAPDPYAKDLADRLLARRIAALGARPPETP